MSLLGSFEKLIEHGGNSSYGGAECKDQFDERDFYQLCLIPAITITILLAAAKKRRSVLLKVLNGRPGLPHPMDTMTRSTRMSYACAFGAMANLIYNVVWNQSFAIDYNGPVYWKLFIALLSMLIYGLAYFPIFACLALKTAFSFGIGSVYSWMFTVLDLVRLSDCDYESESTGRLIYSFIRILPVLLCDVYLSISLPIRFGVACYKGRYFTSNEDMEDVIESVEKIRDSYQGQHVRKLLTRPVIKPPPKGFSEKAKSKVLGLIHTCIYQRQKGFRYPSRLLSVMFVAGVVLYVITVGLLATVVPILDTIVTNCERELDYGVGWSDIPGEPTEYRNERSNLRLAIYFADVTRACVISSISVAGLISILTMLHMLTSFRKNLYAMYRGDYSFIPPPKDKSAASLCVGSIKFAGFQVAYIFWSYIICCLILFIVFMIVAVAIILVKEGYDGWLINILKLMPGVVISLILMVLQIILAKTVFLQDEGEHMRLDNRRIFFIFTYFMFFYNIFLGLVSCLLRIIKAIGVGIIFLARLDNSTLPRKFEFLDPGFSAYQGFIHMEAAHTHPVVIVFLRLLTSLSKQRSSLKATEGINDEILNMDKISDSRKNSTSCDLYNDVKNESKTSDQPSNVAARFHWHVAYTLLQNPQVRIYRKGFIQAMQKARKIGLRIPISDRLITDFDWVKSQEERDKEQQEEVKKIYEEGIQASQATSTENNVAMNGADYKHKLVNLKQRFFGRKKDPKNECDSKQEEETCIEMADINDVNFIHIDTTEVHVEDSKVVV